MKPTELLLLALVAWTVIGSLGIALRVHRRDHATARRHLLWIAAAWAVYLSLLVCLSLLQPARVVPMGRDQCFDEMCFAVVGVQQMPGFLIRDNSHLLQVQVRITNHGHTAPEREALLRAYLRDAQGRTFTPVRGLSGNRLTAPVSPGGTVLSEPVFRVPADATGMQLVFTHGKRQPGILVLGDSDSLLHHPTVVPLQP